LNILLFGNIGGKKIKKIKKMNRLSDYNDIYKEKTIFIIGNGPQLDKLTNEQISIIEDQVSIGTNASYLSIESSYYIAGHISVMLLTGHFTSKQANRIFHGEPQHFPFPNEWNVLSLANQNIVSPLGFLPKPTIDQEILIGAENVALSATHLAFIMGARKIVYIGFDFKSNSHFYDINIKTYNNLKSNVEKILDLYSYDDFIYNDIMDFYKARDFDNPLTNERINHLKSQPFLSFSTPVYNSILEKFSYIFNIFKDNNIEVISTQENSIITDAGAKYIPLVKILKNE
jgi:hypothetical protein